MWKKWCWAIVNWLRRTYKALDEMDFSPETHAKLAVIAKYLAPAATTAFLAYLKGLVEAHGKEWVEEKTDDAIEEIKGWLNIKFGIKF